MPGSGPDDEVVSLTERVRADLESRSEVVDFSIEPDDVVGVIATVEGTDVVEHYHVTQETLPTGEEELHWELLGEDPTA